MDRRYDLFISYARSDIGIAKNLYEKLSLKGLSVFLDIELIRPGENFIEALETANKNSNYMLVLASKAGLNSKHVKAEWQSFLLRSDNNLIPALLEDIELPDQLKTRQWVDFRDENNFESNIEKIINRITDGQRVPGPLEPCSNLLDPINNDEDRQQRINEIKILTPIELVNCISTLLKLLIQISQSDDDTEVYSTILTRCADTIVDTDEYKGDSINLFRLLHLEVVSRVAYQIKQTIETNDPKEALIRHFARDRSLVEACISMIAKNAGRKVKVKAYYKGEPELVEAVYAHINTAIAAIASQILDVMPKAMHDKIIDVAAGQILAQIQTFFENASSQSRLLSEPYTEIRNALGTAETVRQFKSARELLHRQLVQEVSGNK
jgi:hypothetical protein